MVKTKGSTQLERLRKFELNVAIGLLVLTVFLMFIGARVLEKYTPMVVISGSMKPTMQVNGVSIIDKSVKYSEVKINDVIVFNTQYGLVVHRVVEITQEGLFTKGDNNADKDYWVITADKLVGKVIYTNNAVAPFTTLLFGDLLNISTVRLGLGIAFLVLLSVLCVVVLNFLFDYIKLYFFMKIDKGVVLTQSLDFYEDEITEEDLDLVLKLYNSKVSLGTKILMLYYILKLFENFRKESDVVSDGNRFFNKIVKLADKDINKPNE